MKKTEDLRIVFMGTPEFAVATLKKLIEAGLNVVGVVTAPDKPAGRGMQLQQSAVKQYAESKNLLVLQPEKLKSAEFIDALKELQADVQVVVAFRMLPEMVWSMPPMGTINVHGSLLPQYRGAAPINWAIINGEPFTGVTTFKLQHEIDTGNILNSEIIPIAPDENAGSVHDRMMEIGAALLLKTIEGICNESISEKPQEDIIQTTTSPLRHAPKIFTETCQIQWDKPGTEIHNLIRGLSPYPGAFTQLDEKRLKIFSGRFIPTNNTQTEIGMAVMEGKDILKFKCSDGFYAVETLQMEGKKKMNVAEFLRGYKSN
jgi:methionyl-tRNA formyltransferase